MVSYAWIQVRPAPAAPGELPRPDLALTGATTAKPTFTFPLKTTAASDDGTFEFRLTATSSDGKSRTDNVVVTEQRDVLAATRDRWRAGDDLVGTGTQENARLSFHSGSLTGPVLGTGRRGQRRLDGARHQHPADRRQAATSGPTTATSGR